MKSERIYKPRGKTKKLLELLKRRDRSVQELTGLLESSEPSTRMMLLGLERRGLIERCPTVYKAL